jgi:hypothetical protein
MNLGKVEAEYDYDDRHAAAAVKIQSSFRGGQARTRLRAAKHYSRNSRGASVA